MTQEQRERIAETIGMLDILNAVALDKEKEYLSSLLVSQSEILQDMLDKDARHP